MDSGQSLRPEEEEALRQLGSRLGTKGLDPCEGPQDLACIGPGSGLEELFRRLEAFRDAQFLRMQEVFF